MNRTTRKEGKRNPLWESLASVKLTIVLLLLLAFLSVLGTFIPQQEEAMQFVQRLSPGLARLFISFHLFDMYHSIWFRFVIGTLALNLAVCSVERFPRTWILFRASPKPDRAGPFEGTSTAEGFSVEGDVRGVADRMEVPLRARYGHVERKVSETEEFLYIQKGRYSYFGVYFVHASVILILIGGMIGSFLGFEAFVNIPEGESVDSVVVRKSGLPMELGFSVRCDKFTVEFYDEGLPKEYRSEISFVENGHVALRQSLLVNHPATFRGISFYQSSYGALPGESARVSITRKGAAPEKTFLDLAVGNPVELPGDGGLLLLADIRADFMKMGPAVHLAIQPPQGEEMHLWVFQNWEKIKQRFPGAFERFQKFDPEGYEPYSFALERIASRYYTGLQVARDPGVHLVWIGCILMIFGFFVTFFVSHRQIWVRVSPDEGGRTGIRVAGKANRNPMGLEREMDQAQRRLQALFGI